MRLQWYKRVRDACFSSRQQRRWTYQNQRRWYEYGSDQGARARVNAIKGSIDLLSAYLYSGDLLYFALTHRDTSEENEADASSAFTRRLSFDGVGLDTETQVTWALNHGTTIQKLLQADGGGVTPYYVNPGDFGVYREDIPHLSRQTAMCHRYAMGRDDVVRALVGHPEVLGDRERLAAKMRDLPWESYGREAPASGVRRIVASAIDATGNTAGSLWPPATATSGFVSQPPTPRVRAPVVWCDELWVWDDEGATVGHPWRMVRIAGDVLIYDGPAPFVRGEQPFRKFQPYEIPDYFWGASWLDLLTGSQEWRTRRIEQIIENQLLQINPPYTMEGTRQAVEKTFGLRRPGTSSSLGPAGKLSPHRPPPIDAPNEDVGFIDDQISIAAQVNELLQAASRGRDSEHALSLATLAGVTVKRMAVRIERQVEDAAGLAFAILHDYEPKESEGFEGVKFSALPRDMWVRVAAHSASPLFGYECRQIAEALLKAGAIDGPEYIDLINPPERAALRKRAVQIEKAKAQVQEEELKIKAEASRH